MRALARRHAGTGTGRGRVRCLTEGRSILGGARLALEAALSVEGEPAQRGRSCGRLQGAAWRSSSPSAQMPWREGPDAPFILWCQVTQPTGTALREAAAVISQLISSQRLQRQ